MGLKHPPDKLAFIDTETTGLDPAVHEVFEVAMVVRDPEYKRPHNHRVASGVWDYTRREHYWMKPEQLGQATGQALQVNRYYQRWCDRTTRYRGTGSNRKLDYEKVDGALVTERSKVAYHIAKYTADATIIGAKPDFDARFLEVMLRQHGFAPAWKHRFVDVESMAMPILGWAVPRSLSDTAKELEITVHEGKRHTAMGDVELTIAVYEKLLEMHPSLDVTREMDAIEPEEG